MSGHFYLDWAALSISLFNTIVLLWLGMTVLLNADERTWGIWLAGSGLLAGGVFFISHTAILGHESLVFTPGLDFWWVVGWVPVVALPFAWYMIILWYTGIWDVPRTPIQKRQIRLFYLPLTLFLCLLGLLLFNAPPSFSQISHYDLTASLSFSGIPILLLLYPLYILVCIGLSIDALHHPQPSPRLMGDLARQRAIPWLNGVSLLLMLVGLLVGGVLFWIFNKVHNGAVFLREVRLELVIAWLDLIIATCISCAVILLGQAIISHEIFTGKTLPRRGLARFWQRTLVLAAGFSLVVGWSMSIHLRPVYSLLLSVLILTIFFALLGWRLFSEREALIDSLRPFVASQQLFDQMITSSETQPAAHFKLFFALCEILGLHQAALVPLGSISLLVHSPLVYPQERMDSQLSGWLSTISTVDLQPGTSGFPVDPRRADGYLWAVPLWSSHGVSGLMLLGEKQDNGLFTQEEVEMARAAGERILDAMAGSELAQRLMQLQRQQMVESQVTDRRLRRALHDEVLPKLHEAILALNGLDVPDEERKQAALSTLTGTHHQVSNLLRGLKSQAALDVNRLGLFEALKEIIHDELDGAFEKVEWFLSLETLKNLQSLPPVVSEVLFYAAREAMRNASRHARQSFESPLILTISATFQNGLRICIEDNGGGITAAGSGKSGGSSQGLTLHSTMMSIIGGTLVTESLPGKSTRVILDIPEASGMLINPINNGAT